MPKHLDVPDEFKALIEKRENGDRRTAGKAKPQAAKADASAQRTAKEKSPLRRRPVKLIERPVEPQAVRRSQLARGIAAMQLARSEPRVLVELHVVPQGIQRSEDDGRRGCEMALSVRAQAHVQHGVGQEIELKLRRRLAEAQFVRRHAVDKVGADTRWLQESSSPT